MKKGFLTTKRKLKLSKELGRFANSLKKISPLCAMYLKENVDKSCLRLSKQLAYENSQSQLRPCHREELFVQSRGDIYPCCLIWKDEDIKIGHISDKDILEKIENYQGICHCQRFKLDYKSRKPLEYDMLNVELSYKCQAKCAMCCVGAPDVSDECKYEYYDDLEKLIGTIKPKELRVQGGEVLIQKDALDWLEKIKNKYTDMEFAIVTNGNVPDTFVEQVEKIFDRVFISIVGFQPETYKKIMGLNFFQMKNFAEKLHKNNKVELHLKYLLTANNFHELNLFLDWAINIVPDYIIIADSNVKGYINMNTFDNYWQKILDRTEKDVKNLLIKYKDFLMENKAEIIEVIPFESTIRPFVKLKPLKKLNDKRLKAIEFEYTSRHLFNINQEFLNENKLNKIIRLVDY